VEPTKPSKALPIDMMLLKEEYPLKGNSNMEVIFKDSLHSTMKAGLS